MDPTQLQPGFRLDRYELLCPLAYGGMASVWLARFGGRKGFERLVVVKMILPQYSQDPRFQEMFVDEARIASRIEHANVARILDVGEQEENTFIVMEWVDGDSLSKVVRAAEQKKQRVPAGVALRVCADAASGLHAAHVLKERDGTMLGVVHRDVSPQNILISNAGTTVIIDFGVAKARDRVSQDTSAGQLKGKIRYMAPEQALGRSIDHRADVWALGAILYELFAGVPPYDGPNEVATLHKLTSGLSPAPLAPSVPAPIRAVVDRAIAYEPDDRFATALELNLALESAMIEIGEPTTAAVVAQYTGQLLADRKNARRRAVDTALDQAHARDADRQSMSHPPAAASSPGVGSASGVGSSAAPTGHSTRHRQHSSTAVMPFPTPPPPPSGAEPIASSPSMGPMGLAELPSAASGATLGSAAIEYFPASIDDPARRRRTVAAVVLGLCIAAGVIGAVLIISTAVLKRDGQRDPRTNAGEGTSQIAPPESTDQASSPPTPNGAGAATATPVAAEDPPAAPPTNVIAPPPPAPPPTTVATVAPSVTPTPVTTAASGSGTGGVAATAKHPPAPAVTTARPKPPTTPPPTSTQKPDRGF